MEGRHHHWPAALHSVRDTLALHPSVLMNHPILILLALPCIVFCLFKNQQLPSGHLEELRSLLTQSSWEVVSPLPIMLHVLLFFRRCIIPSVSEPESH